MWRNRWLTPRPCNVDRLPVREQSRIAAGPYVSRTRGIWWATSSSASSQEIRSNCPRASGPRPPQRVLQPIRVVHTLGLAEAAHARVERRHLGGPAARIGADLHDLPVAHVGVDGAPAAAVVSARAGDDALARLGRDPRRFVDDPGPTHGNNPTKFRAVVELRNDHWPLWTTSSHQARFQLADHRPSAGMRPRVRLDSGQPSSTEVFMRLIGLAIALALTLGLTRAPIVAEAQQARKVWRIGVLAPKE